MPTSNLKAKPTASQDSAGAIFQALQFLNSATQSAPHASRELQNEVPTALFRTAIETLAGHKTYEAFEATKPNLRALLRDALNWSGHGRATKVVNRAITQAMTGTDKTGHSTYPQALEMLSFLAVCAPMLEPDRLARIAQLVTETPNAYAPIIFPTVVSTQLQTLLRNFPDHRKEQLLASLWTEAHEGRWWESQEVWIETPTAPRRRRRQRNEEQESISAAQVESLLAGHRSATVQLVSAAFATNTLHYSEQATDAIANVPVASAKDRAALRDARNYTDPDTPVLLSYIKSSYPTDRPASPIPEMVKQLVKYLGDEYGKDEPFPEKPESWYELHPAASLEPFPVSKRELEVLAECLKQPDAQSLRLTGYIIKHSAQLRANADFMGNCTFSYRDSCESGTLLMGYITDAINHYNFSISTRGPEGQRYSLREVNSRFNGGAVPEEVRNVLDGYVTALQQQ